MEKLQRNLGWVVTGIIAAAAIGILALKVLPNLGSIRSTQQQISDKIFALSNSTTAAPADPNAAGGAGTQTAPQQGPPVMPQQIAQYQQIRGLMVTHHSRTRTYYADVDAAFEQWFDGLSSPPVPDDFSSEYQARTRGNADSLERRLIDAGIEIGYPRATDAILRRGFNWEDLSAETLPLLRDNPEYLHLLQKRFWIRRRIVDAILGDRDTPSGVQVTRLLEIRFLRVLSGLDPELPSTGGQAPGRDQIPYVDFPPAYLEQIFGAQMARTFYEPYWTQGRLGRAITFGATVEIQARHVPAFLARIADMNSQPPMAVQIISWRMAAWQENAESRAAWAPAGQQDEVRRREEALVQPTPVILMFLAQAIDIDPEQMPTFGP